MSLQLGLRSTYGFPGSVLDGYIKSRPEHGMQLTRKSLTVTLHGRSKTRVPICSTTENTVCGGSDDFLKISESLYGQVRIASNFLEDGETSHFRIRFPEDATFKHIRANTARWPRIRELPQAQSLPPAGEFGFGNTIEYSVEVAVTNQASSDEITTSIPITFSPTREEIVPDPNITSVVQTRLLTNKPQELDYCSIRLVLNGPTAIAQNDKFPLVLKLLDIIGDRSSPQPIVSIRSGYVKLLQHTVAWTNDNYGHRWTDVHTIVSRDFFAKNGPPQITKEGIDLAALFLGPIISQEFSPSFRSTNLERTYGLKVRLAVQCGEGVCEFSFDINPVAVLPGELHCMALARQQDEFWENPYEESPFPDAVNKLRQTLGI